MAYLAFLSAMESKEIGDPSIPWNNLMALEIFHAFALIHDDIIDKGAERHGVVTIHRFVAKKVGNGDVGNAQAILVGDLLFSWAQELMVKGGTNEAVISEFFSMIEEVVLGQMIDVDLTRMKTVDKDMVMKKNRMKTSGYSFIQPLKIGTLLANPQLSKSKSQFYEKIGSYLGEAFQVQDDLLDVIGNPKETGKGVLVDFEAGQHTSLSIELFHLAKKGDKKAKAVVKLFKKTLSKAERLFVLDYFSQSPIVDQAKNHVAAQYTKAINLLKKEDMSPATREHFLFLINQLSNRIHG